MSNYFCNHNNFSLGHQAYEKKIITCNTDNLSFLS